MYIRVTAKCKFLTLVLNKNFQVKYFETWINQSFRTQVPINFNVSQYFALKNDAKWVNPYLADVLILYPHESTTKPSVFWCFQIVKSGNIG